MTKRTSFVGGTLSIIAVILLSFLCKDLVEDGGVLQQILAPAVEDSIDPGIDAPKGEPRGQAVTPPGTPWTIR